MKPLLRLFIITALLRLGADVNQTDTEENTALHLVTRSDDHSTHCLQVLIESNQVFVNSRNEDHNTPLHLCCRNGMVREAALILEKGWSQSCSFFFFVLFLHLNLNMLRP